jgi:membrane-bound metal-dependent hydrolase YbcI (DUF457 family)
LPQAGRASPRPLAAIVAIDLLLAARRWPRAAVGLLDESAHLITGGVLARAVAPDPTPAFTAGLLAGSVLLDLDHVPEAIGVRSRRRGGRPSPHALVTPLAVALLARAGAARRAPLRRQALRGLTLGLAGHLARDLATPLRGGGAPLLWPLSRRRVTVPYVAYLLVLRLAERRAATVPPA